jgi:transcriptional regulator with XRE-family HTH domain
MDNNYYKISDEPLLIVQLIAERVKKMRLDMNLTTRDLEELTDVAASKIRKFELVGKLDFMDLVKIAITFNREKEFISLFMKKEPPVMEEIPEVKKSTKKRRVSTKLPGSGRKPHKVTPQNKVAPPKTTTKKTK